MEGDGGVVAMAQALKDAGLAFMATDGCKASLAPMISPPRFGANKVGCYHNNAYRIIRGQSSVAFTDSHKRKRSPYGNEEKFIASLRKYYKSPERSISADFIQRLLTYTHQKSCLMKSSCSHCPRVLRRSRDTTRRSSPSATRRSRHRSRSPCCRDDSPDSKGRDRKERRSLDESYDYLKSPVNRISPTRVAEVRYLNDITKFVKKLETWRNCSAPFEYQFDPFEYHPCPVLSRRMMEHRKRCPKANANQKKDSETNASDRNRGQTCSHENNMFQDSSSKFSKSVQASCHQDPCDCEDSNLLKKLRFLPLPSCAEVICPETAEYHEWLDDKLREMICDWIKTIPVNGDFDDNDKEVRRFIAKDLRFKILRLIRDDKDTGIKDAALESLAKMPMWYPDDDKRKFQEKIADNLVNNVNDFNAQLKMFDILFEEWFEELKLKPVDEDGIELDKERIKTQLSHSIKPIVIDRIIEDERKTNLKFETLNIVEDLPLDVQENTNQYVREVSSKLIDRFTKTDRDKMLGKKKNEQEPPTADESTGNIKKENKNKSDKQSEKKRKSRNGYSSSVTSRRDSEDVNVSLTLSGPYYERRDTKIKTLEMYNVIRDWFSTMPQLADLTKENTENMKELAKQVVKIQENTVKDEDKEDALKEEVMEWLSNVVEKEDVEMKPKSMIKFANDLVKKIEQVYTVPLEEIKRSKTTDDSDDSFDYLDDEVYDLLQEVNKLPNELLKSEYQGPILKLAKGIKDLQDASLVTIRKLFKTEAQSWLDNALNKEKIKMDSKTKNFIIGDLLERLGNAKSVNYELSTLEDEFIREIMGWIVNIPQIAKVKDNEEYETTVKDLAKELKQVLQQKDASEARVVIRDKIGDLLHNTLEKEGEQIDETERKKLLDDLLNNLIRKSKKHSIAAIYKHAIKEWLDDITELERLTEKVEFQRPIAKLADKIAELNKEAETDTVKNEIKDEVNLWLGKVIEKEKVKIHESQKARMVGTLMESINTIDTNRLNFETIITKWLNDIPEIANAANNKEFKNEIINLAIDLYMFQRRHGIDGTDTRDTILNRLRDFLDNALESEGTNLSDEDKDEFINKLLSSLIESSNQLDATVNDKILAEVKDWLGEIPELTDALKHENVKEMTYKLAADLNKLQDDETDNLEVKEELTEIIKSYLNWVCDTEKVEMTGKEKREITNNLMKRLETFILDSTEDKEDDEILDEEEESDDIPEWLDEVPGLNEAIHKKDDKKPRTISMLASIMSLSNIEYDFGQEINKYLNTSDGVCNTMNEYEQRLFDKLTKKLLRLNDDYESRCELENDIEDYLDVICKRRRKYIDFKTKSLIAAKLIAKAKMRLDQEILAYNISKKLIKSLQTWSSLMSVDTEQYEDTDSFSSDKREVKRRRYDRRRWNKDIGFQFSSSETENSVSRKPSPVKLLKNRQKMNTNHFVSKHSNFSTKSSPIPNRRAAARDNLPSTSGQAETLEGIQGRSYNTNADRNDTRETSAYEPKTNSYKRCPFNNSQTYKRKLKVYYTDDKKDEKKHETNKQISQLEKEAKKTISTVIEKGKHKLPTSNSNQVKRKIIKILREKVGLSESKAWPLAENIIKKAKSVYKSDNDKSDFDLRDSIIDEIREILDEACITTHRDELEQGLTDLLSDEILFGEIDTYTKSSVFNILRSADVYDSVADSLTSQVMERVSEINKKVKTSGIKITPDTFRDIAEREVTDFIAARIDEMTPFIQRKIRNATPSLIDVLESIMLDSRKTSRVKTIEMKSELKDYFRKLPLDNSEGKDVMADILIGRLFARMNPARSRLHMNKTALFRLSTDLGRNNESLPLPLKKQEFIKLAAKEITDFLDDKCRNMNKSLRDQLINPTGDLLDKLGDIVIDNSMKHNDKKELIGREIYKFVDDLPMNIGSPEDCTKELMFKLENIFSLFLYSDDLSEIKRVSVSILPVSTNQSPRLSKAQSNSNVEKVNSTDQRLSLNTKINIKTPQSKASDDDAIEKDILDFISTKIDAVTQEDKDLKTIITELLQTAKTIGADPDISLEDKIYQLNECIANYIRSIPLADENKKGEVADTIFSKLEVKLLNKGFATSTPRQSLQESMLKTNEQCYLSQLRSIIENWVDELPVIQDSIEDSSLKHDMIENLVTDIDNRQKYLQINMVLKPCCEEELENLKYQVFRWLNKFLEIDDLSPFLSNISALMDRIKRVSVPKLVKPSNKVLQEEIDKFVEQSSPYLLANNDRSYQQQCVKELADRLLSDIEKTDASARIDASLQKWIPKMFTGTIQDLKRLSDMLRSTLKKKGLLESKVEKAHKTATDVLNDSIENWCEDLPLYGNLEEQDQVRKIKTDLSNKLIHKIAQLNLNPQIFYDEFLYEDMVTDEIDKLTEWLPKNPELDKYLPALTKDLVSQIKCARQDIMEEIAGQAYKFQLKDVINNTLKTSEALTPEDLASLELIKENLVDAFISVHYSFDGAEGKKILKDKIACEVNKFCYDFFRRHPRCSFNSSKVNRELYEALLSVSIPTDGSIRTEVEQLNIKNTIKEWMSYLPLKEETNREKLAHTKIITKLAKRLHEIEQAKDINPNLDMNGKMFEEIIKTMKKLNLKTTNDSELPKMASKLVETLSQTEEHRCALATDDKSKTIDDSNCSCSSRPDKHSKCGLSVSDKVHLQKIRERVKARMCKDASVNPPPVDRSSQIDITVTRPCEKPVYDNSSSKKILPTTCSWADPVYPKLSQSSTQTANCAKTTSQEINPQIIIREHCWDSVESTVPKKRFEVSPPTSAKISTHKPTVRDSATQDVSGLAKVESCVCNCESCSKSRMRKSNLTPLPPKSPQNSSDNDNLTSCEYESWEVERPSSKRRTRRCRTRGRDVEHPQRRDGELGYWNDRRPVLRSNVVSIPSDVEAFMKMRNCKCDDQHKPRRPNRSEQFMCAKCSTSKYPYQR